MGGRQIGGKGGGGSVLVSVGRPIGSIIGCSRLPIHLTSATNTGGQRRIVEEEIEVSGEASMKVVWFGPIARHRQAKSSSRKKRIRNGRMYRNPTPPGNKNVSPNWGLGLMLKSK